MCPRTRPRGRLKLSVPPDDIFFGLPGRKGQPEDPKPADPRRVREPENTAENGKCRRFGPPNPFESRYESSLNGSTAPWGRRGACRFALKTTRIRTSRRNDASPHFSTWAPRRSPATVRTAGACPGDFHGPGSPRNSVVVLQRPPVCVGSSVRARARGPSRRAAASARPANRVDTGRVAAYGMSSATGQKKHGSAWT